MLALKPVPSVWLSAFPQTAEFLFQALHPKAGLLTSVEEEEEVTGRQIIIDAQADARGRNPAPYMVTLKEGSFYTANLSVFTAGLP